MEEEKLESLLIDYIDGKLTEADRAVVEKELAINPRAAKLLSELNELMAAMNSQQELLPTGSLKINFERLLKEEMTMQHPPVKLGGKQVMFSSFAWRVAAAVVLVMVGVAIGYWINRTQQREQELADLKQEMLEMKQAMMTKLNNDQSASQRMLGVSAAYQLESADDDIVQALVIAMNEDPSSNVRLAALEALGKFSHEPKVHEALVKSLSLQKDPIVQIPLIQLLVKMKEKGVVKELQRIADDEGTMKAVKDEAYSGILKLS